VIDGILPIDKPSGWTSHDVVARVRRLAGQREVGHAGTLDPLATGLLLVVLGRATRLSSYVMDSEKSYRAEVALGVATTTDDSEGEVIEVTAVPKLDAGRVEACLRPLTGEIDQLPPAYSAVHQGGERLYRLARQGAEIVPRPRRVAVHELRLEALELPVLRLFVRCGSGTYVRSLARDLGAALGTGGHLRSLRRTASGSFSVAEAVQLDGLTRDGVVRAVEPLDRAVLDWPAAALSAPQARDIGHGRPIELGRPVSGNVRLYGPDGGLAALGRGCGGEVRPFRVFMQAESGAHSS
jgi:tRNA pseudouridine55 synthase